MNSISTQKILSFHIDVHLLTSQLLDAIYRSAQEHREFSITKQER